MGVYMILWYLSFPELYLCGLRFGSTLLYRYIIGRVAWSNRNLDFRPFQQGWQPAGATPASMSPGLRHPPLHIIHLQSAVSDSVHHTNWKYPPLHYQTPFDLFAIK